MAEIQKISLYNGGGFVARIIVPYEAKLIETDGEGHVTAKVVSGAYYQSKDINLSTSRTVNLDDIKIKCDGKEYPLPDGAHVKLKVDVRAGTDNTAAQEHTYKRGCGVTASYVITGTTLNNQLGERSVS